MSADLVAFLRERLDADGQIARAAAGTGTGRWTQNSDDLYGHTGRVEDEHGEAVVYDEGAPTEDEAKHIARWDPARVLAEVDAKRRLVELHDRAHSCPAYDSDDDGGYVEGHAPVRAGVACVTLCLLALPYASRPGYRPGWAPDA